MRRASLVICAALALLLAAPALAGSAGAPRTERVDVSSSGSQANLDSGEITLSADGRFAAFSSSSTNLVPHDTNKSTDVFVRDRLTGRTERVSVSSSGAQGNGHSASGAAPAISADGRYVAFMSSATNLVPGRDRNGREEDAYVRDRKLHRTIRASVSSSGKQGGAGQFAERVGISGDGRSVVFVSHNELAPEDRRNSHRDVYVRNLRTHKTQLVSVGLGGHAADRLSVDPAISGDGRFVAFSSAAHNLVTGTSRRTFSIYVRDLKKHVTSVVSRNSSGRPAWRGGANPSISADGRFVAFGSSAANLVPGDTNGLEDVFLRDIRLGTTERVSVSSAGTQSVEDHAGAGLFAVSAHGEYVVFVSAADDLVPGDTNSRQPDVFLRDVAGHTTTLESRNSAGVQGNAGSFAPTISADGRFVGFMSSATSLVTPDSNGSSTDAFVRGPLRP